jgi:hypothetical protein
LLALSFANLYLDLQVFKNNVKFKFILLIIILGPQALAIGPIAYLIAGRNKPKGGRAPKRRILPPDDDPDFLGKL